jgi:uncharacterized membrane protein YbaN (DUF454 family)
MEQTMKKVDTVGSLPGKVLACVVAVAFLALGAVGLILPIIPGLLFLALAAFIVVKSFPSVEALARRHRVMDQHLDRIDRMHDLNLGSKIRLAGLLSVKMLLDGLAFIASSLARLRGDRRGA